VKTLNRSRNISNWRIMSVTRFHVSNTHQTISVTNILPSVLIKFGRRETVRGDPRAHGGWRGGGLLIAPLPRQPPVAAPASLAAAPPSRAARTPASLGSGLYATGSGVRGA
jgi:hypothetical protein